MTAPPFIFNHKNGELIHNGKMVPLSDNHKKMFACFAEAMVQGARIGHGAIAKATSLPVDVIDDEMPKLCKRLKLVDISIHSSQNSGKWLVFDEPQPSWKPRIAPPVRLEGEP